MKKLQLLFSNSSKLRPLNFCALFKGTQKTFLHNKDSFLVTSIFKNTNIFQFVCANLPFFFLPSPTTAA